MVDSDFGREITFKMSMAFNLEAKIEVKQIKQLRPFKEIQPNQVRKKLPYEEFWVTDEELKHLNGDQKVPDINISGIGVTNFPLILQSGRRTAIEKQINSRNLPFEVTAFMIQGDLKSTTYLSEQPLTRRDL